MRKIYLILLFSLFCIQSRAQTAASYSFSAFAGSYSSISSSGTALHTGGSCGGIGIIGDDCTVTSVAIGFTFNYCGTNYTTLSVCSNGWISLANSTSNVWTNTSGNIPGAGFIMAYWDDLEGYSSIPSSAYYITTGTAPNRVFTVEWKDFGTFSGCGTSCQANFQIKLYETSNVIDFIYGSSSYTGRSATIGIANSTTDWQTLPTPGTSPTPSSTTFTSSINPSPATDQVYRWFNQCTGMPSAGAVTPLPSSGCATYTSTVTLTGSSLGGGITYQWQMSSDSTTWTSITGATNALYTATVTANVFLRAIVTCTYSGLIDTSDGRQLFLYPPPSAILGASTVCAGTTITLSDTTAGGFWFSSTTSVATVGSSTGVVTGVSAGTSTITYRMPTGCIATKTITVNTAPGAILGPLSVCTGFTVTLSNAVGGGTWTSGSPGVATIGSSSGVVTGVATGTSLITYSLGAGCTITAVLTVNPTPAPISGLTVVCQSSTITLSDATGGGIWSSSSTTIATIDASSGVVTGMSGGTATISYTVSTLCAATITVTVNPLPSMIVGLSTVCEGSTIALTSATPGGTWSSSTPSVATIGATTGIVRGVSAGTTVVTYRLSTGCLVTTIINVDPLPAPISGLNVVCQGNRVTLSDATAGGTWSSSMPSVATVNPTSGVVTGTVAGTAIISYTIGTGCAATMVFTVYPLPSPILGITSVCVGSTTTLINTGGGTWVSSNPGVATIGSSSGIVTGVSAGTTTITYTLPTGCFNTININVNNAPAPITGPSSMCIGVAITLTTTSTGGFWTSGTTSVATVTSSGVVRGVSAGTTLISYTVFSTGCRALHVVTVTSGPVPITGVTSFCIGSTTTLSNITTGGTWSSGTPTVATIGSSSGIVTSVSVGTSMVTYSTGLGCSVTTMITVNPLPTAILGTFTLCPGSTTTLSSATAGGTWSMTGAGVATVGSTSGVVSGISTGTTVVTYMVTVTGCARTATVTVNPPPSAILGALAVCVGGTATLSSASGAGTWSSGATGIATVGASTGVFTGLSAGTATITYTSGTSGCSITAAVTVNPSPGLFTVTGGGSFCAGGTGVAIGLSGSAPGVSYQLLESGTPVGSPVAGTGAVISFGTFTTAGTYTVLATSAATGCTRTMTGSAIITINPLPAAIGGPTAVCVGATIALTNTSTGGTWSSSTTSTATIGSASGVVTGVALGTTVITYRLPTGCFITTTVSVSLSPTTIAGATSVCAGATITLTNAVGGGSWTSSATGVASIGLVNGVVTGVAPGTSTITYSLGSGCTVTRVVTVTPGPGTISGPGAVCIGATASLTATTSGGIWASSNAAVATVVSGTGVVTGVTAGTVTISYTLSGCTATTTLTVSLSPATITGPTSVCVGDRMTLTNAVSGGVWSSSSTTVASIGSSTGVVEGLAAGSTTISYSLGTGCIVTRSINVNPIPAAISGPVTLCVGSVGTLSSSTTGGTWSSSTAVATIHVSTGEIRALSAGVFVATYALGTGCARTYTITVVPAPGAIAGPTGLCAGTTATLSNSIGGGTWSSSNTSVATINPSTGFVSGLTAGTTLISYTLGSGCNSTIILSVGPSPSAISGPSALCVGTTITLTNAVGGGAWTSSLPGVATIGASSGVVYGVSTGTTSITYGFGSGCSSVFSVTVSPSPGPILGVAAICSGNTTTLTNIAGGGTWISGTTSVATIDALSGALVAVAGGVTTITYSLGGGCTVTRSFTVHPGASVISGSTGVCIGATISLSNAVAGGSWSSSNTTVATISSAGVVSGVSIGTSVISYVLSTGCSAAITVTVNPTPTTILGAGTVCQGAALTLSNAIGGGSWSSSNGSVATIGFSSGIINGLVGGTATITYSLGAGCIATKSVVVHPSFPILGSTGVCMGLTATLSNPLSGGTWSPTTGTIATVGATSGIVTGITPGTMVVTYTLPTGCAVTTTITVNSLPAPITGSLSVCFGGTGTLTTATGGGTWSSSRLTVATVGAFTGEAYGVSTGITIITYSMGSGCTVTAVLTVQPLPSILSSGTAVCLGATSTLSGTPAGGTWSSASATVTVSASTGEVFGVSLGTALVTYILPTGCQRSVVVTVNPVPTAILGATSLCAAATTTLANATGGGTWSSSNATIATVGSTTGVVYAVNPGTVNITYRITSSGCFAVASVSVVPIPSAITGPTFVCIGSVVTLATSSTGGIWSSADTASAIIDGSGHVTGIASGTVIMSYTLGTGCRRITSIVVNPISPISGPTTVCVGDYITLTDTTGGGTWSTSSSAIATASGVTTFTGRVYGVSGGTVGITYTTGGGCQAFYTVTVLPAPTPVLGVSAVCLGLTTTLSSTTAGGTWSSSDAAVASIVPLGSSVEVFGAMLGTSTISYLQPSGCAATRVVTVYPLPGAISGATDVCVGSVTTLSDAAGGGGSWTSSASGIAPVGATTGIVTGSTAGPATITYTLGTGCISTIGVMVHPLPLPITGPSALCLGTTITLSNLTAGGIWSSSSPGTASVDATSGVVYGVAAGTAVIRYTIPATGCFVSFAVTVNALPPAVLGTPNVCVGNTTTLSSMAAGGTWVSSDITIATINTTIGLMGGVSPGAAFVTYTLGTGCITTVYVNVYPLPLPISGSLDACEGGTTTLTSFTAGGSWISSRSAVATIDPSSGVVYGVLAGTTTITYTIAGTGCITTATLRVSPTPSVIFGASNVCLGSTITLTNLVSGGTWLSSNTAVATIGSTTGVVTSLAVGNTTITYSVGVGCAVTRNIDVFPLPVAYTVTGGGNFCSGGSGVRIYLTGSQIGVNYLLYLGATPVGTYPGTGSGLDFGLHTVGGTYRVVATSTSTGCSRTMLGTATIVVDPLAVPAVRIAPTPGDTVCEGTSVTFAAMPVNGGSAPLYQWRVNGVNVGTAPSYSFIPAHGDAVWVRLTSNARCALPDTASATLVMTVDAYRTPVANVTASPGDTVCYGNEVTLNATAEYGGATPHYTWMKNGVFAATGPTYRYVPTHGDMVYAIMASTYACRDRDTVWSSSRIFTIDSPLVPEVTITGRYMTWFGAKDTLRASVVNGGDAPLYQWIINGAPVAGATNATFITDRFQNNDSVSCQVTNNDGCAIMSHGWVYMLVSPLGVGETGSVTGLTLKPNPAKGAFTITGKCNTGDEPILLQMTDMLGHVVHTAQLLPQNGRLNDKVMPDAQLAAGMYLVTLRTGTETVVLHVVLE